MRFRGTAGICAVLAFAGGSPARGDDVGASLGKSSRAQEDSQDRALEESLFQSARPRRALNKVLTVEWRRELADVSDPLLYKPQELGQPAIDPNTGNLFVATREGKVIAIDEDGKVLWDFKGIGTFVAGPTFANGHLFAANGGGVLYCLDAVNGKQIWSYNAKEELVTAPVVTKDLVYVVSSADALFAVGTADGKWQWQHRRDSASTLTVQGAARPAVKDGVVFAGFADGYAVALDAKDGTVKWTTRLSLATHSQLYDVDADPVFGPDGSLYMASYSDGVYRLKPENGQVEWHTAVSSVASLAIRNWTLYVGAADHLYSMNAANGKLGWELPMKSLAPRTPIFAGDMVVASTSGPLLFANANTGEPIRAFDPGRGVCASPIFAHGKLYVWSNRGELYSLRLDRQIHP